MGGFIGAAKQSDMLIQGFLGATSGLTGSEQPTDIGNDFTKNSSDSIRKVLDDLKNGQKFIQQDVNEALFRPKTNKDKNLQEFCENLQKSIHDLADKTDLILNSPTSSVDTEKLIAEIAPMIASQIKKTDDDFPEKIKEMFATTKYEYECIQKLVHQNTE